MAYLSRVNLDLPVQPITQDKEDFSNLLPVYNAIHILSWAQEQNWENFESGDDTKKPNEAMKFLRWFYGKCAVTIKKGDVISCIRRARAYNPDTEDFGVIEGWVPGAPANYTADVGSPTGTLGMGTVGFALTDAAPGELVQIGIGPAVIEVESDLVRMGVTILARPCMIKAVGIAAQGESIFDGGLYVVPIFRDLVAVGGAVADNMVMIQPMVDYYGWQAALGAFFTPVADGGGS